jgi:hypothetical protein
MQRLVASLNIPDGWLIWAALIVLNLLALFVGQKASAGDVELKCSAGYKRPMLALELNAGAAPEMYKCWDESTKKSLRTALLWDYLFIFIYSASISAAGFLVARYLDNQQFLAFEYSLIIFFLQLIAAVLDATENVALLKVLRGPIASPWPQLARGCAILKFSLISVNLAYVLFGVGVWLYKTLLGNR